MASSDIRAGGLRDAEAADEGGLGRGIPVFHLLSPGLVGQALLAWEFCS